MSEVMNATSDPRYTTYHSWDAANKTLALVRAKIVPRSIIAEEARVWISVIDEILALYDTIDSIDSHITAVSQIRKGISAIHRWINSLVVIQSAEVRDILGGQLVKSVSGRERARLLKEMISNVNEIPKCAIVEHQGSRIGSATPTFNLAVAHQLCYHYADTDAEFVSINSGRKNKIALAPHLTLEIIAAQHGKKIRRDPSDFSSDQKKAVRKLHSAENMKWFCRMWGCNALDGIKPGLVNHVADAFMQMIVHHFA